MYLRALGWNSFFQDHWDSRGYHGLKPARVVEEQREAYRVVSNAGELSSEVTGHFRHTAADRAAFPAVGDWVAIESIGEEQKAAIHEVLPRRTKLSRKSAGERSIEQILVANIDIVLIVTSLNIDLNPRRIERYLATVWESGAHPVLVLSKADLCPDPHRTAREIAAIAPGVGLHIVSAMTGDGLDELAPYIAPGNTAVLVGSSGVGKSTIINRMLNCEIQITRDIRANDGRGRHATSYRRLFLTPTGGVLIDTPGLRELHLWDAGRLEDTFEEIEQLSTNCHYRDCQHETEPGCVVQHAIEAGTLDPERLGNFKKLKRELEHLDRRRDLAALSEQRKRWKQISKAMRKHYRDRPD